jgi:hypothetical protein
MAWTNYEAGVEGALRSPDAFSNGGDQTLEPYRPVFSSVLGRTNLFPVLEGYFDPGVVERV